MSASTRSVTGCAVAVAVALLCLLTVFVAVTAYDFEDAAFNARLIGDLDEYAISSARSRREADLDVDEFFQCKQRNQKVCCGKSSLFKNFGDKDKKAGKACYREMADKFKRKDDLDEDLVDIFSCEQIKLMKKKHFCIHECIGKRKNLLNSDGSLNVPAMRTYLQQELFTEEWHKKVGEKAMEKCFNERFVSSWPESDGDIKCNPTSVQFQHCLWKQIELNCPDGEWKDSRRCNKIKEYLLKQELSKKNKITNQ